MRVTLNGEATQLDERITVDAVRLQLRLGDRRVAIELNGAIVPRSRWTETTLRDGDRLEIVHAIGGG